jgi:hypothetical protein
VHWNHRDDARVEDSEFAIVMLGYGQKMASVAWQCRTRVMLSKTAASVSGTSSRQNRCPGQCCDASYHFSASRGLTALRDELWTRRQTNAGCVIGTTSAMSARLQYVRGKCVRT